MELTASAVGHQKTSSAPELVIFGGKTRFLPQIDLFQPLQTPQLLFTTWNRAYIAARESNGPLGHIPSSVALYGTSTGTRIDLDNARRIPELRQ